MDDPHGIWQAAAAAQAAVTALCAALVAGFFLGRLRREVSPGRRTAAAALALTALGALTQGTSLLAAGADGRLAVVAGMPACAGQVLAALLVLRQIDHD